jgi:hypothetical protein
MVVIGLMSVFVSTRVKLLGPRIPRPSPRETPAAHVSNRKLLNFYRFDTSQRWLDIPNDERRLSVGKKHSPSDNFRPLRFGIVIPQFKW